MGPIKIGLMSAKSIEVNNEPCILSITRDITDRKRAEEALRQSEDRFAKAFRISPDSIAISRLDNGVYR